MLFFELLRLALGSQKELSQIPSEEEWEDLFNESIRQAVAGITYRGINLLPATQRPPKQVLVNWHSAAQKIIFDNKRLNHDSIWVSERFLKVGFRNAILKGQGNALLYPDPLLRTSGDIDIWLDGNRDTIIDYVTKFFPKIKVQWQEVEFPVRKDTCIEVHTIPALMFHPCDRKRMEAFFDQYREEIFTNEVSLPNEEGKIRIPTLRVNLVFQLIHIYRHIFNEGIGLRQLVDYYYLLQSITEGQFFLLKETADHIQRLHMTRFVRALMWVLQEVFHLQNHLLILPPDELEGKFLLNEIMMAGNFGKYDIRNETKDSKWGNFWQQTIRNLRFIRRYPREVIWNPVYRIAQFIWRIKKGYH